MKIIREVAASSYSRGRYAMGDLVDDGYMTKRYIQNTEYMTIEWTLNPDAPFSVNNGMDPIIEPGDSVLWEK